MHPFVNIATKAATKAGNLIIRSLNNMGSISVSEKGKNDFVTDIDKLVERDLIQSIQKIYPNHNIWGEESGKMTAKNKSDVTWIIDPIDGTTNFIHDFPNFAISIGIKEKGTIQHGVIFDPVKQELFTASRGEGAQLNGKRIRVSRCLSFKRALISTGFPPGLTDVEVEQHFKIFRELIQNCSDIRCIGSSALDLAYVACGRLEGYVEKAIKAWDIAAGVILVQEAGGFISDYSGGGDYLEKGEIVAAPPKVHSHILNLLRNNY